MMTFALYDTGMLSLTRREQTVLVLVLIFFVAGAGIRHLRMMHALPRESASLIAKTR
jgi:hypothetical protein